MVIYCLIIKYNLIFTKDLFNNQIRHERNFIELNPSELMKNFVGLRHKLFYKRDHPGPHPSIKTHYFLSKFPIQLHCSVKSFSSLDKSKAGG